MAHDPFDPATYRDEAIAPATRAFNATFTENYQKQPKMYEPGGERPVGPPPPKSPRGVDRTIKAKDGREIGIRVVAPDNPKGVYLHIHGGGLVFGAADAQDPMYERIIGNTGLACVSVEYRLAPANPYPAAWDDCEAAALWLAKNAKSEFGTDRVTIGGESAGATLAVPTLVRMRDRHGFTGWRAANLSYGNFDTTMTPSQTYVGEACGFLGPRDINWCSDQYAPDKKERRNPDMSALYANLKDMPPALFTCGTLDAFLDDSMFVYSRWISSGNYAELAVYPGGLHAFNMFPIPIADEANARIDAFLKRQTT
jgi:acetyl esterase